MSDLNSIELQIFTTKARADKAINSLKGILIGINLDANVNSSELNELMLWTELHHDLIDRNPFQDFMNLIKETLSENVPLSETIEDLYWLCQKYENDSFYYNAITADLQILHGICHGILADGIINEKEIFDLKKWLEDNSHLNTYYPYDEIRSLVLSIVADGIIEPEEILVLKAFLNQFIKIEDLEISKQIENEIADINIAGHCTSEPDIKFKDKTFCVTGVLKSGNRSSLEKRLIDLGGIPVKTVTKNTDYLIVGDNGNPAWAFSCYGRKVEKALELRKQGQQISLIHEFDLIDAIEDLN